MVTHTLKANNTEIHNGKDIVHPPLYCIQFNSESVCVINVWQLKVSPRLQRPVYYLRFEVLAKSHAGGGQDYVTLYISNKHTWDVLNCQSLEMYVSLRYLNVEMTMSFYQKFLWLS